LLAGDLALGAKGLTFLEQAEIVNTVKAKRKIQIAIRRINDLLC
jgi:hypothetical protein